MVGPASRVGRACGLILDGILLDPALLRDRQGAAVPGSVFYQFCLVHQLQTDLA